MSVGDSDNVIFYKLIEDELMQPGRKRCCCNCGHCLRMNDGSGCITNICDVDNHYVGYLETFDGWCRHWKKDKKWTKKAVDMADEM